MYDAGRVDMVDPVRELADDLPNPGFIEPFDDLTVLFEEEGEGTEAELGLDE